MSVKEKETVITNTVECISQLAEIVKDNELSRLKISTEEIDIVIEGKRCPPPPPMGMPHHHEGGMQHIDTGHSTAAENAESDANKPCGNIITSPIIGTFYSAPSPDKAPFVKVGDTVSAGDVVCIIESMKLMNELNSDFGGRVAEIYVNNGEAVEYGQKLMRIE